MNNSAENAYRRLRDATDGQNKKDVDELWAYIELLEKRLKSIEALMAKPLNE